MVSRVSTSRKRKFTKKRRVTFSRFVNKRKSVSSGTVVGRTIGFPRMLKFKHIYSESILLTDNGGPQNYLFSANGMYDPNYTGTGHQPMYFDQVGALYNHYCVIGSKITIRAVPQGTSVQNPYKIVLWVNDDTNVSPTVDGIMEFKGAKTRLCTGGINPSQIVLTQSWSAKKYFGGSPLANTNLQGTTSSNPIEQSYYNITLRTLDGISTVSVWFQVQIEYIAIWKELKEILIS